MKTYIIAEIGINHNGSLDNCFKMIEAAVQAGCQAAKFQSFKSDRLYPKTAGKVRWKDQKGSPFEYDIYSAVKGFELPFEWIGELVAHCRRNHIDFISSVFDEPSLDLLIEAGMEKIKLASSTLTHIPLIRACARTGLPVILSTGGASLGETEEAVNTLEQYHTDISLLHCSLSYPTNPEDCNLGVLNTLKTAFPDTKIGYSDHSLSVKEVPTAVVALGGSVIEKHITLDKTMEGPDHFFALEPQELTAMVNAVRKAESLNPGKAPPIDKDLLGSSQKKCFPHEKYIRDFTYMSLFASRDIKKGEIIHAKDIRILRPGKKKRGLSPKHLDLFTKNRVTARIDIHKEDSIFWESIL